MIRLDGPGGAVVRVGVDPNLEREGIERLRDRAKDGIANRRPWATLLVDEWATLPGFEAWEFGYEDGGRRFRHIVIGGNEMPWTIEVVCEADAEPFRESEAAFEKIVEAIRIGE